MAVSGGVSDGFSSHLYPCITDVVEQDFVENIPAVAYSKYSAKGWTVVPWSLVSAVQEGKQQRE